MGSSVRGRMPRTFFSFHVVEPVGVGVMASGGYAPGVDEPLRLVVLDGPADPVSGEVLVCPTSGASLGRSAQCMHCLRDPSVSRTHARVVRRGGEWFLSDARSTGGTYLNGARLERGGVARIVEGDEIEIGPWRLRVGERRARERPIVRPLGESGTRATVHAPSRRLMALSACIDALSHAAGEDDLARAALEWAIVGTGFARGVVLRPGGQGVQLITGVEHEGGKFREIAPDEVGVTMTLVRAAAEGNTAVLSELEEIAQTSESIAQRAIHSAVCCPVILDGRVSHLMYLDSRAREMRVDDAAGFCEDIAQVFGLALSYQARVRLERRQGELRGELERVRALRDMLNPQETERHGPFEIAHRMRAGLIVSGDLFTVLPCPDGSVAVLLGDATGHGVGAAMITALTQAHLHAQLSQGIGIGEAICTTNRFLASRQTGGSFISLWGGRFSPDGRVEFVDAGHGHWLVVRSGAAPDVPARAEGLPLGIDSEARYTPGSLRLAQSDRVVLYTDGVGEALGDGSTPGSELGDLLASSNDPEEDVRRIMRAIEASEAVEDDATIASIGLTLTGQ